MKGQSYHIPVMREEVDKYLVHNQGGIYVDATLGGGGHSAYLLDKYPRIRILGIDYDSDAIRESKERFLTYSDRIELRKNNFSHIAQAVRAIGAEHVDGVLADLGVSSWQFDNKTRGFSFDSENLDMRMDPTLEKTAKDIINELDAKELERIFEDFGEEPFAKLIAEHIVRERNRERITSGQRLAEVVSVVKRRRGRVHPATKVFQALRIAVNGELENLVMFLNQVPSVLTQGGRVVIIDYHSLEDRIVKNSFKEMAGRGIYRVLTKHVIVPTRQETLVNRRSRSAKLRAAEKIC